MKKYILSFIFGFLCSSIFLFGESFLGISNTFEKIATKYYQVFHPEQLIKNGKTYTVSFGFVPVIQNEEVIPVKKETKIIQPKLSISYTYQNNYDKFSKEEVEVIFKEIENSWSECGVILKYNEKQNGTNPYYSGKSIYSQEGNEKSINYLYWVEEDGIYGQANAESSQELNSNTKPFISKFNIKLSTTIETKEQLKATLVHEFGHVIGLDHSSDPKSVMFAEGGKRNQLSVPNEYDLAECKNVLNQIDLAKSNKMLN